MSAAAGGPRRTAWVESPLQLVNAIEWAAATSQPLLVCPRAGVAQLDATVAAVSGRLPDGVEIAPPAAAPYRGPFARARLRLIGDPFSGQVKAVVAVRLGDAVLVDDGSASLHLAEALAGRGPLRRMGQHEGTMHRGLGALALGRLRRAMGDGRIELFTAYSTTPAVAALARLGARIVRNDYGWTRGHRGADATPVQRTVVLGTALVEDSYVDGDAHAAWIAGLADAEPVTYLPHRRESPGRLAELAALPGVTVVETGLPVELVLGGSAVERVVTLPSSAAASLRRVLGDGVAIDVAAVPEAWWTERADTTIRQTLGSLESRSDDEQR